MSAHEEPEGYEGDVTVTVDGGPARSARAAATERDVWGNTPRRHRPPTVPVEVLDSTPWRPRLASLR